MTNEQMQRIRDALVLAKHGRLSESAYETALRILDAALAAEPQQPVGWVSVKDSMPKSGVTVLACYKNRLGNLRRIRAEWTDAKTVESNSDDEFFDYDEATDCYYAPEGWYECIDNWDEYSSVKVSEGEITHWMALPLAPDDPNYSAPPSREWQGFGYEEVEELQSGMTATHREVRAIESALRAKNEVKP